MRIYTFKTLPGLMKASQENQFTLYEFLEGRFYRTGKQFKMTQQLSEELLQLFARAIWERQWKIKAKKLGRLKPCGILRRVYISFYDKKYEGKYCAGQDYPSEIRFIQRMANNS